MSTSAAGSGSGGGNANAAMLRLASDLKQMKQDPPEVGLRDTPHRAYNVGKRGLLC